MEEGRDICDNSPTLNEEWIKKVLGEIVCENDVYDESTIRDKIDKIKNFNIYIIVCYKNGDEEKMAICNS